MRPVHRLFVWAVILLIAVASIAHAQMSSLANRNLEQLSISGGALAVNVSRWGGSVVTGGAGAVAAGTPRVTLGSDDPAVVVLQAVGHTRNEAFGQAAAVGGELDDTAPVAATEGNVSPWRITPQRAGHTNLRNNAGTEVGTATDPLRFDPTGTTRQPVDPISGQAGVQGGSGVVTALTQRMVLATDVALPAGTNILGALSANQSINVSQINSVTPLMGAGVTGTGSPRVSLATDANNVDIERMPAAATIDTENAGLVADTTLEGATANMRLMSATAQENAGTPANAFGMLRHGVSTPPCTGNVIAYIKLGPSQSWSMSWGPRVLAVASGVCLDWVSGTIDINIATVVESAP